MLREQGVVVVRWRGRSRRPHWLAGPRHLRRDGRRRRPDLAGGDRLGPGLARSRCPRLGGRSFGGLGRDRLGLGLLQLRLSRRLGVFGSCRRRLCRRLSGQRFGRSLGGQLLGPSFRDHVGLRGRDLDRVGLGLVVARRARARVRQAAQPRRAGSTRRRPR